MTFDASAIGDDLAVFQAAAALVVDRLEGGGELVHDTGGATRWGISQRAYPDVDIEGLTHEHALRLYRADYWQRMRCYDMPRPIALAVFDTAVNLGQPQAARLLQRVVGVVQDGVVGPRTIQAVRGVAPDALVARLLGARCRFYRNLADSRPGVYLTSLDGWMNRVCTIAVEAGKWCRA